jgi:hypothetical protein
VGLEPVQVSAGEERREPRIGQDAGVEVVDDGADGRRPADAVVDAHLRIPLKQARPERRACVSTGRAMTGWDGPVKYRV